MKKNLFVWYAFVVILGVLPMSEPALAKAQTEVYLQELQTRSKVFLDKTTGLEWVKMSESGRAVSWHEAQAWIKSLGVGWRAPTVKELDQIEKNRFYLSFIKTIEFVMWADQRDKHTAWIYTFSKGTVGYYDKGGSARKTRAIAVRRSRPEKLHPSPSNKQ